MPTNTLGTLQRVAQTMKQQAAAARQGHAYHRLSNGLHVVYGQRAGHWRLAIGRTTPSQPSTQELEIVAKAFAAPFDFEPVQRKATWWDPLDDCARTYNVLEITWRQFEEPGSELAELPTAKQELGYA